MKTVFIYTSKIWLTALLLSPTLAWLIYKLGDTLVAYANRNKIAYTGVFYGTDVFKISKTEIILLQLAVSCLPYWILLFLINIYLNKRNVKVLNMKLIMTSLVIVITSLCFVIFPVVEFEIVFNPLLAWFTSFSLFLIAAIWFYKLKLAKHDLLSIHPPK
jgi:hypothetical protein